MMTTGKESAADEDNLHELLEYKERFKIALKMAKICVFEVDLTRQLYTFFENAEDIYGISGESILQDVQPYSMLTPDEYQKAVSEYFSHEDDADVINKAFMNIFNGKPATYQARMKAGKTAYKWCKIDVTPIMQGDKPVRMIGVVADISDMKAKTELLEDKTRLDMFTGLYNKQYSEEVIENVICKEGNQKHALILFDLDNFKAINDTHGHAAGDEVLKSVSQNLKKIFRKTDIIGRFGGDEFVILLRNIEDTEFLVSKLEKLLNMDNHYMVSKSIGVAIFPDNAVEFDELVKKADIALYQSKRSKNTYTTYSELRDTVF